MYMDGCMYNEIYILMIIHHLVDWPKCVYYWSRILFEYVLERGMSFVHVMKILSVM